MRSRWLEWPRAPEIIEKTANPEPTKPSFDGFDGSVSGCIPITQTSEIKEKPVPAVPLGEIIEKDLQGEPTKPTKPEPARTQSGVSAASPTLKSSSVPRGVHLVRWDLREPPVAIDTCSVVTDSALFASTTLEQLRAALANPKRWVGWSVAQLIDRLAQVGVTVTLEIYKSPESQS